MAKLNLSGVSTRPPRAPSPWPLSPQQEAILSSVNRPEGNLIIEARAGTGKTSTLIEVCKDIGSGAAFLAFNKAIAVEIQRKLAAENISDKQVKGATFHSVGFQAWVRHAPDCARNVRGEKLSILAEKIGMPKMFHAFCTKLVSLAKQACVGAIPELSIDDDFIWQQIIDHHDLMDLMPENDWEQTQMDEEEWRETGLAWALKLLKQSIVEAPSLVDFDDMIYMPLYAGLRFWQYDWVLVDEAQDTNRARREISKKLLRPGGRLIAVGDRHQAIYGFTGADSDALDLIQQDFQCSLLPLTVTYRCAENIVRLAQTWVPDIEWHPGAPPGILRDTDYLQFLEGPVPKPGDAILCRNTKPLVQLAFYYLRRHIPCHVEGREIGGALITLIKKFRVDTIAELQVKLDEHLDQQRARLLAQHKEAKLGQLTDKIETIQVLADTFDTKDRPYQLIALIDSMFKDGDNLPKMTMTLSTIHKAKGREWDTVYILGRSTLMPSPYARQEWQLEQERNLMYVAVTRAKNTLVDVHLPSGRK